MVTTVEKNAGTAKLEIREVGKVFKTKSGETTALEKTSFTINEGEFVTILGLLDAESRPFFELSRA
ncbi:hypothetical protein RCG23_02500 [Neobacillus sp. PS3-34]|uniref:hypothetical protein n=1 Tax=Neobacillus sp. PS3-34 TaxID=3070678 RepID=UPI0027E07D35|nr:hypothetical protein [Neobacillus sp. PS3-34]WML48998.1 hypothetical protein RCG23_02500 [Neobacillus sp. PS3-34]